MPSNDENIRSWLRQARNLSILLFKRVALHNDNCPINSSGMDEDSRNTLEMNLLNIGEEIRQHCNAMRLAETQTGVGIINLLGDKSKNDYLYSSAVLLVLSRISPSVDQETRDIGRICQACTPCSPGSLEIRDSFRANFGVLRPHVYIKYPDRNIDDWQVQMHETSLNLVFHRESTTEEIALQVLPKELFLTRRM